MKIADELHRHRLGVPMGETFSIATAAEPVTTDEPYEACPICETSGTTDGLECVNCEGEGVVAHECDEDAARLP